MALLSRRDTHHRSAATQAQQHAPPAGFIREVYDRVPDASDPNGSRLDGPKPDQLPVAVEFLGRPFDEARLIEIASAYEAGTNHRRPPKGFGPLRGER